MVIKILLIAVSAFFVIMMIWILKNTQWLRYRYLADLTELSTYRPYGAKKIDRDWQQIRSRLETGSESEYKLAVIEADSLLDNILKRMGYSGESLGDRLKTLTSATIPNIDVIKEGHQVRNNIIHDPDYQLELEEAKKILDAYEQAFVSLQVL